MHFDHADERRPEMDGVEVLATARAVLV